MLNLKQKALLALLQPNNSEFDFSVLSAEDWDAVRKESYAQAVPIVAFDGTARCKQYIPKEVYTAWFENSMQCLVRNSQVLSSQNKLVKILVQLIFLLGLI